MHPTGIARCGTAPRSARFAHGVVCVGVAVMVALAGTSALVPAVGAESTTPELQQAGTSNGGVASATTSGRRVFGGGYIITGSNRLLIVVPENSPSSDAVWTVTAQEATTSDTSSWSVQAFAICANTT
jgi:hypothetical protein